MKRFSLLLLSVLAVGCAPSSDSSSTSSTAAAPDSATVVEAGEAAPLSEEILTALVKADQLDGTEDKKITRCYICGLGMAGADGYSAQIGEYTATFCSEACCQMFQENPEKVILETEIPAATAAL